jgi:hypothetical protein
MPKRQDITYQPRGNWRLYTQTLPAGATALGVIGVGVQSGALIRTQAGVYAQINAGCIKVLDQTRIEALVACRAEQP